MKNKLLYLLLIVSSNLVWAGAPMSKQEIQRLEILKSKVNQRQATQAEINEFNNLHKKWLAQQKHYAD